MILLCQKQCYTGFFNVKKLGKKPNIIVNCYDSGNSIPQQFLFFEGWDSGLSITVLCKNYYLSERCQSYSQGQEMCGLDICNQARIRFLLRSQIDL